MNKVFEKPILAGIKLNNHILRSATHEGMADVSGFPTEALTKKYIALAKGGVGCIITGYMGVSIQGKSPLFHMTMIDRDECIEPLAQIAQAVHACNTPIIAQIAHCGSQTSKKATGCQTVAPSRTGRAKAMTEAQIEQTISDFVSAIQRVKKAGFDGVQLHMAHGYLLSAFVSPLTNKRTDAWGGNTEKRFNVVMEILQKAKTEVGDFPIFVKMNGTEKSHKGMTMSESVKIAQMLEVYGCAGIEVSCGMIRDGLYSSRGLVPWKMVISKSPILSKLPCFIQKIIGLALERIMKSPEPQKLFNLKAAEQIKKAVSIPVIVGGGVDNLADIEYIINDEICDYVSMSRPLIMEPNLVNKFRENKQSKARCINCNYCLISMNNEPLRCYDGKTKV